MMAHAMRCACVDIGTNTTRLLVADCSDEGLREVLALRAFLRLRPRPDGTGLGPDVVRRLADLVASHVQLARRQGAARIRVVGTAAIRAAPDRDALCAAVREVCGERVDVLDAGQEAELAFAGAIRTLPTPPPDGVLGVADVGGGSSELVVGTPAGGVSWSASVPLGSGVLTDRHVRADPPAAAELDALRAEVAAGFGRLRPDPPPAAAFAVGGSATSLRRLAGGELTPAVIENALAVLCSSPSEELARRLDLHAKRVRLLPAGLLLLEGAWAAFGGAPLHVANGGLREGVLLREFAGARPGG